MAITSDSADLTAVVTGSIQRFKGTRILLRIHIRPDDTVQIEALCFDSGGTDYYGVGTFEYTATELDAYTGSGSGEYEIFKNVCEQAVKATLEGISENSGNTYTIV